MNLETKDTLDMNKKTWDIYIPDGTDPVEYLINTFCFDGRDPYVKLLDIMKQPSARYGMPPEVKRAIRNYLDKNEPMDIEKRDRLDWSPKSNWVEEQGGLPKYIEDIAVALIRDHGMKRERAIAVAINRVKMWAAGGGGVKADTRAKAAKAVAQWEAMKAKTKAKG